MEFWDALQLSNFSRKNIKYFWIIKIKIKTQLGMGHMLLIMIFRQTGGFL